MKNILIVLLTLSVLFISCNNNYKLNRALIFSGANRPELEKVLTHYSQNPADSLKYRAAVFLIENMPGHQSYIAEGMALFSELALPVIKLDSLPEYKIKAMEDISSEISKNIRVEQDIRMITAQYLINNIDKAFESWQGRWARHLNFAEFCEFLLPYKVTELQPLDEWRDSLCNKFDTLSERLYHSEEYENLNLEITNAINQKMKSELHPYLGGYNGYPFLSAGIIDKVPFGTCGDYSISAMAVMRSKGIPMVMDFTPQWTNRRLGHSWNVLLLNDGRICDFGAIADEDPGVINKRYERKAKVYRKMYAHNPDLIELQNKEQFPPEAFKSIFFKDVTDQYMKTTDITISIELNKQLKNKYVYLAVFNNNDWVPIAYGKRSGGKVTFKNLGKNFIFMPVFSTKHGLVPINQPFKLRYDGKVEFIRPDPNAEKHTFVLTRKFPTRKNTYDNAERIIGGKFQVAGKPDFSDARTFFEIDKWYSQCSIRTDTLVAARYWRFYSADNAHCYISEIMFFDITDSTKRVSGKVMGTLGSWENNKKKTREAAFDGDILTHYDAATPSGAWVGMDFGKPMNFSRIIYYPVTDGNNIEVGDSYELYIWDNGRWKCIGNQVAKDIALTFDNIPAGGLYLLDDITKGQEKRIFTWENGKQVWW